MKFEEPTPTQQAKAQTCTTPEDVLALAKEEDSNFQTKARTKCQVAREDMYAIIVTASYRRKTTASNN